MPGMRPTPGTAPIHDGSVSNADASPLAGPAPVRRRRCFYISGFDPQGPAHYHRMQVEEGAKCALLGGYPLEVSGRDRVGPQTARWWLRRQAGGATSQEPLSEAASIETEVRFLRWDDIIRQHWPRSRAELAWMTLGNFLRLVGSGMMWRIVQACWPTALALSLPVLLWLGAALGAVALLGLAWGGLQVGGWGLASAVGGLGALALAAGLRAALRRVQGAWLMRSTRFMWRQAFGVPAFETRLDEMAEQVREALHEAAAGGLDEVLVVGHSSGAILAASVAARALRDSAPVPPTASAPRLSLLTLAHCIPMIGFHPAAAAFRDELRILGHSDRLDWLDMTAPADGCSFVLTDPMICLPRRERETRVPPYRGPRLLSPRFAQLFSAERWLQIRPDKYRVHFQYLLAGEQADPSGQGWDFFEVVAGPRPLSMALGGRPSAGPWRPFRRFGDPAR